MTGVLRQLATSRRAVIGLAILGAFALIALIGPLLVGDPAAMVARPLSPPSWEHWLGTTGQGQDVLAQTIAGARTTLLVGFAVQVAHQVVGPDLADAHARKDHGPIRDIVLKALAFPLAVTVAALVVVALWGEALLGIFGPEFAGARPNIFNAPPAVQFNVVNTVSRIFEIDVTMTDEANSIDRVVLLRPAAVTHHFDYDQRYIELKINAVIYNQWNPEEVLLRIESPQEDLGPAGYYMLFAIEKENAARVPSEGVFIKFTPAS